MTKIIMNRVGTNFYETPSTPTYTEFYECYSLTVHSCHLCHYYCGNSLLACIENNVVVLKLNLAVAE